MTDQMLRSQLRRFELDNLKLDAATLKTLTDAAESIGPESLSRRLAS